MGENGTPPGRLHLEVEHEKWFWNMKGQLWVDIIQTMNANEVDHPVRSFGIYMPAAPIGVPTHRRRVSTYFCQLQLFFFPYSVGTLLTK